MIAVRSDDSLGLPVMKSVIGVLEANHVTPSPMPALNAFFPERPLKKDPVLSK